MIDSTNVGPIVTVIKTVTNNLIIILPILAAAVGTIIGYIKGKDKK